MASNRLSDQQRAVLERLAQHGGACDLADLPPAPDATSRSRSLRLLERRGLIVRMGPEGRPYAGRTGFLRLTHAGREIFKKNSLLGFVVDRSLLDNKAMSNSNPVKKLRKALGQTQTQFALNAGVSNTLVHLVESGAVGEPLALWEGLRRLKSVDVDELRYRYAAWRAAQARALRKAAGAEEF